MADRVVNTDEERPRDTVVVEREGKNSAGLIILAIIGFLLLLYFLFANPFGGSDGTVDDVDINVPTPTVDTQQPAAPTAPAQ